MMNNITADTWISSDHHFGHANIIQFEPRRLEHSNKLGYENWEQMLIGEHNKLVQPEDSVLFLGDFSFKNPLYYSDRLNGKKQLILGNHDRKGSQPYADFEQVYRGVYVDWNGRTFIHQADDYMLSAVIKEVDGESLGFCHYTPGYHDDYDDQRESARFIKERKQILLELFDTFGVDIVIHGHLHSRLVDETNGHFKYINACLEHHEFKPVRLGELLSKL